MAWLVRYNLPSPCQVALTFPLLQYASLLAVKLLLPSSYREIIRTKASQHPRAVNQLAIFSDRH